MSPRAADVLLHPVRLRIVQTVAGRRLTASAIADTLGDVPQASLYRQINALLDAGVLAITETRPARGATERVYVLADGAGNLVPADLASATRDEHVELAEMNGRLNAAVAPALQNAPAPDRRRRMLTSVLIPGA